MIAGRAKARAVHGPARTAPRARARLLVPTARGRVALDDTGGAGLPLVLLHGNSSSARAFAAMTDGAPGRRRRLVTLDLLGHGRSDDAGDAGRDYTLTGQADAVVEALERVGIERAALLGWSLGGHVALEVAASMPGIAGVALVGAPPVGRTGDAILPAFRPGPALALAGQQDWDEAERGLFLREAGLLGLDGADADARRADGRARAAMVSDLLAGGASDERAIVAALPVPLLVALGADDPIVDPAWVEAQRYRNLWRGRTQVFPRCGHAPFLDAPELFAEMLARFMADVEAEAEDAGGDALGGWLGG